MKDPVPTDIPFQRPAARNNIYLICILISCTLMTDWPMRAQRVASGLGNVHLFMANGICYVNVSTTSRSSVPVECVKSSLRVATCLWNLIKTTFTEARE